MRTQRKAQQPIEVHEDEPLSDENETVLDESRDPLAESSGCAASDESDEEVEDSVPEDMAKFEESFKEIAGQYRLINRIGEGALTFPQHTLHFHLTIKCRHVLDRLQGRRPSI